MVPLPVIGTPELLLTAWPHCVVAPEAGMFGPPGFTTPGLLGTSKILPHVVAVVDALVGGVSGENWYVTLKLPESVVALRADKTALAALVPRLGRGPDAVAARCVGPFEVSANATGMPTAAAHRVHTSATITVCLVRLGRGP